MMHRSIGSRRAKRVFVSLVASACLVAGSPFVGVSSAASGAHKPVSATHGDCKNDNSGKHNGYDCPQPVTNPVDTTGGSTGSTGGTDVPTVVNDPTTIVIS
jgi:hypothetical protein